MVKLKNVYCIMANNCAIWPQNAHITYQLSSPSCSTTAIKYKIKRLKLMKQCWIFWLESQETGPLAEKSQGRKRKRTKQEKQERRIGKGNQMTAEIPDRRNTSDIPGLRIWSNLSARMLHQEPRSFLVCEFRWGRQSWNDAHWWRVPCLRVPTMHVKHSQGLLKSYPNQPGLRSGRSGFTARHCAQHC